MNPVFFFKKQQQLQCTISFGKTWNMKENTVLCVLSVFTLLTVNSYRHVKQCFHLKVLRKRSQICSRAPAQCKMIR